MRSFRYKVFLALLLAIFGPFLPVLNASVKQKETGRDQRIELVRSQIDQEDFSRQLQTSRVPNVELLDQLSIETAELNSDTAITDDKANKIREFLVQVDELAKKYAFTPELVAFRAKLATRIGYNSPLCAAPLVAAGGGFLGILQVAAIVIVVVVVAVVVVNGVIQISSGGGGLSNPIDPAREAIEQAIRDCYRQIEVLQALLQAAASSEEFQMIMDMIIAKWQEIDNLLRQLWDLLYPGSGRVSHAIDMWEELE